MDACINEAARTIMSVKTSRKYQRKIGVSIANRTMVIVTVRSEYVSPRCPDCAVGLEKSLAKKKSGFCCTVPLEIMLLAMLHRVHLLLSSFDIHLVAAHLDRDYGSEKISQSWVARKIWKKQLLELSQQRKVVLIGQKRKSGLSPPTTSKFYLT